MQGFRRSLITLNSSPSNSLTIDLGRERPFLAWVTVTMIDSTADFDRDNAIAADIFKVDGVRVGGTHIFGGDHWGPNGSDENVFPGSHRGFGRRIEFWLRAMHPSDLDARAEAVVLTLD